MEPGPDGGIAVPGAAGVPDSGKPAAPRLRYFLEDLDPSRVFLGILNRLRDKGIFDQQDIQDVLVGAAVEGMGRSSVDDLPKLRKWLVVAEIPDGTVIVEDPVFWRTWGFNSFARELFTRLDGKTSPSSLIEAAKGRGETLTASQVDAFLLRLSSLDLLETDRTKKLAESVLDQEKAFRPQSSITVEAPIEDPRGMDLVFMDGARYQCFACGTSCTYPFPLGPIGDAERKAIEAFDWSAIYGDKKAFFREGARVDFDGTVEPVYYLEKRPDGACVFLDTDGKCRVHKHMGQPSKPYACRKWPYSFFKLQDRIIVSTRFRCFDKMHFTESRLCVDDAPEIQKLLVGQVFDSAPDEILLDEGVTVPLCDYLALEAAWRERIADGPGTVFERLVAGGVLLEEAIARAKPDGARSAGWKPAEKPDSLSQVLLHLYRHFYRAFVMARGEDALLRELCIFWYSLLRRVSGLPPEEVLCAAIEPGEPLPLDQVALDATEPRIQGNLRYFYLNYLWGKRLLSSSTIRKGYAILVLLSVLHDLYARFLAARRGASGVEPMDMARSIEYLEHMRERAVFQVFLGHSTHVENFISQAGFAAAISSGRSRS